MSERLSKLVPPTGAKHRARRVGRGPGSNWGKTSGKGQKGQRSRSGSGIRRGFEGGQMPLLRRLPKRGFINIFREPVAAVSLARLNVFDGGEVGIEDLKAKGIVPNKAARVKVLANGDLKKPLTIRVHAFSKAALEKIEKAGGKAVLVEERPSGDRK
ncbi:MAG: 50S ribosomal protein L15 [Deltaproteobacteria bacterium]|nr:50S ribosomal protein L15 [Deltaproteobacteria bacterium]